MTTVDFWAVRSDISGTRIELSNGLVGPATTAMHRLRRMIEIGELEGTADAGGAWASGVPGSVLGQILDRLGSNGGAMWVGREGHTDEESLQAAIIDEGVYSLNAVEV